jgi:hypothetical protein
MGVRAEPRDRLKALPLEAQTLLSEGQVGEAIKSLRVSHGIGRRDAKAWVNAYIAQEPILRVQLEAQRLESRRKGFLVFLVVDAFLVAALIWYFFFKP